MSSISSFADFFRARPIREQPQLIDTSTPISQLPSYYTLDDKKEHMKRRITDYLENRMNFPNVRTIIDHNFESWFKKFLGDNREELRRQVSPARTDEILESIEQKIIQNYESHRFDLESNLPNERETSTSFWYTDNDHLEELRSSIDKVKATLRKITNIPNRKFEKFHELRQLEYLTREYASLVHGNDELELKVRVKDTPQLVTYTVEEIPLWWGLCCYGLKPKDNLEAPPLILFHGTKTCPAHISSGVTVLEDFDPFGVGYIAFRMGKKKLEEWLKEATNNGARKAIGSGYSLGGALLTNATVYLNNFFQNAYTFNSPGVGFLVERRWKKIPTNANRPVIVNYDHMDDVISNALGQVKIGENYYVSIENSSDYAHTATLIGQNHIAFKAGPRKMYHPYIQVMVCAIIFPLGLTILFIKRGILGYHKAKLHHSLLGIVMLTSQKIIQLWQRIRQQIPKIAQLFEKPDRSIFITVRPIMRQGYIRA